MAWVRVQLCKLQKRVHSTRSRKWSGTPVSSTINTDLHDIAELLVKVALRHQKSNQTNSQAIRRGCNTYKRIFGLFHHSVFLSDFPPNIYLVVIVYFLQQWYVFVVDWCCLFVNLWVLTVPLEDCTVFGNFVITLICWSQNPTSHGILVVFPLHRKYSYP